MLVYLQHFINFSLLPFPIYEIIFSDFLCRFAISSSTLGNYAKDENIDMSLGNLMTLANFYNVSTDYLLCRTELRQHKNQSVSDLHLNDDAIQILTDKKYNPRLLSELLTHENFKKFMTDLRNAHMKDSNTASDIDYQSMVKNIIDDFTSQIPTTADDDIDSSNDAYINGLLLLFCKNPEMKVTQLSVEEKLTLKEIFSRSKPTKEHRKLRRRNPKL